MLLLGHPPVMRAAGRGAPTAHTGHAVGTDGSLTFAPYHTSPKQDMESTNYKTKLKTKGTVTERRREGRARARSGQRPRAPSPARFSGPPSASRRGGERTRSGARRKHPAPRPSGSRPGGPLAEPWPEVPPTTRRPPARMPQNLPPLCSPVALEDSDSAGEKVWTPPVWGRPRGGHCGERGRVQG